MDSTMYMKILRNKIFGKCKLNIWLSSIFLVLLSYSGVTSAYQQTMQCNASGPKKKSFQFTVTNTLNHSRGLHFSYLFGYKNILNGYGNIQQELMGVYGNQHSNEIERSKISINMEDLGHVYFARTYDNRLVYVEGVKDGSSWKLFNIEYVEKFLENDPKDVLKGQLYPGKRFGPPILVDKNTNGLSTANWILWVEDSTGVANKVNESSSANKTSSVNKPFGSIFPLECLTIE